MSADNDDSATRETPRPRQYRASPLVRACRRLVSRRVSDQAGPLGGEAALYAPRASEPIVSTTDDQLDRLRDELFTATAHAIKTPVAIIKTAAQVLARTAPSQFHESTEILERQSARIDALVENLFALARIRTGTLQLHPMELELAPLVQQIARSAEAASDSCGLQVYLDARARIRADRERLAMILRNTIEAAVRFSRAGQPVTIRLRRCGHDVAIEVSYKPDASGGARGESQEAMEFDEIGVGRFVTKTIVEAHGGTVTDQNGRDRARIRILLPASSDQDQ